MLKFADVLAAIDLAGSATPAFITLFESVKDAFTPQEQGDLKLAMQRAAARSDDLHSDVQAEMARKAQA